MNVAVSPDPELGQVAGQRSDDSSEQAIVVAGVVLRRTIHWRLWGSRRNSTGRAASRTRWIGRAVEDFMRVEVPAGRSTPLAEPPDTPRPHRRERRLRPGSWARRRRISSSCFE